MTLHDILKTKGTTVHSIAPQTTLDEVVQELVRHRIGSLLICDRDVGCGEQLLGIVTERDILYACSAGRGPLESVKVSDVMSKNLITGAPDDSVEEAMGLMTENRIRHLPVLSEGRLVGLVSIGDLVKTQYERLAMENQFMKNYIRG